MERTFTLVGGGLQNALIALCLQRFRPECRVTLVERAARLGGNHTWCFHAGDVPEPAREVVEPLVTHRWEGHAVCFPKGPRRLEGTYGCITSERLDRVVRERLAGDGRFTLRLGTAVRAVAPGRVELEDGSELSGGLVVDSRGPGRVETAAAGYQKFLGQELRTETSHGVTQPLLMDATVPQVDGFRFFYVLPLDERRVLVEDTRFSDTPDLDPAALRAEVQAYATRWGPATVLREEQGVLPLPWAVDVSQVDKDLLRGGYAGGWFHPVTGYAFPVALRLALALSAADSAAELARLRREQARQVRFAQRLNWMLFHLFAPSARWNVLERFYRLPEPVIRRFYALRTTAADRARIVLGRPPQGLDWRRVLPVSALPQELT